MRILIKDLYKELYNNMSHKEWNAKYREAYIKELQNTPIDAWLTQMHPPPGLTRADRTPMPELKVSDLSPWERCKYWWFFRKVRRSFIKERRMSRKEDVKRLAYTNFHKWKS